MRIIANQRHLLRGEPVETPLCHLTRCYKVPVSGEGLLLGTDNRFLRGMIQFSAKRIDCVAAQLVPRLASHILLLLLPQLDYVAKETIRGVALLSRSIWCLRARSSAFICLITFTTFIEDLYRSIGCCSEGFGRASDRRPAVICRTHTRACCSLRNRLFAILARVGILLYWHW